MQISKSCQLVFEGLRCQTWSAGCTVGAVGLGLRMSFSKQDPMGYAEAKAEGVPGMNSTRKIIMVVPEAGHFDPTP